MSITIVVTRDVADRRRGVLASIMPEVAAGIFASPELSKRVRERIWTVVEEWWRTKPGGSAPMVRKDDAAAGRLGVRSLGEPSRVLAELDGALVARRE